MKYSAIIQALENLEEPLKVIPTQANFCKVLDITRATMSYRVKTDANFTDEEVQKLEKAWSCSIGRKSFDTVDVYDFTEVSASAGFGLLPISQAKTKVSIQKHLIKNYAPNKQYSRIKAVGSSMYPTFMTNDLLIVEHYNGDQIKDDTVYVFEYLNEIFVKRLVKNIDQIIIKSDNPEYDKRVIEKDNIKDIHILGEVVGMMRQL